MKDIQCEDCLWCATTFLMLKYQQEHLFCQHRFKDKFYPINDHDDKTIDNTFVQPNLFDI